MHLFLFQKIEKFVKTRQNVNNFLCKRSLCITWWEPTHFSFAVNLKIQFLFRIFFVARPAQLQAASTEFGHLPFFLPGAFAAVHSAQSPPLSGRCSRFLTLIVFKVARTMACVTLKRPLDLDPLEALHSPNRPQKRRRCTPLKSVDR